MYIKNIQKEMYKKFTQKCKRYVQKFTQKCRKRNVHKEM